MSQLEQVLGRHDGAVQVVGIDRGEARRADVVIDGDDRRAERHIDAARGDEQRAVAQRPADPREIAALPADLVDGTPTPREDHEFVARAVDRARDALQELGAERFDVDDEDADHFRAAAAQALRDETRLVAELLDHGPDALRGRLGNAPAVVDHLGDGRYRHSCLGGDVSDRHSTVRHAWSLNHFAIVFENG